MNFKPVIALVTIGLSQICNTEAASINLSTTSTGSRVVLSTSPLLPATGGSFVLGRMANEADFNSFVAFGTGALGTTSAFPTGGVPNGTATNNATATDFAGQGVYILFFSGGATIDVATNAGIYKSTELYAADLNNSSSQTKNLTVSNFTTVINPTINWQFSPASVNPTGITGAAGTPPTDRNGIVFTLGAVPEPSTTLLALSGLACVLRRRRK